MLYLAPVVQAWFVWGTDNTVFLDDSACTTQLIIADVELLRVAQSCYDLNLHTWQALLTQEAKL